MPSVKIPDLNREVYETVVKSIYTDPKKASVREIIANAVDGNKDNDATKSVIVSFNYDSTVVRDFGEGMSPEIIADIYGSMYQSTKRAEDEDDITDRDGEFGIGSKSPYGILYDREQANNRLAVDPTSGIWPYFIDYYLVKTIFNGTAYMYIMYLSEKGIPSYDLIDSKETDEESGTEVTLPITYNLTSTDGKLDPDTQNLIDVLIPFYRHNKTSTSIVIEGSNTLFIEQIKSVLDNTFGYKRLNFIDMSVTNPDQRVHKRDFGVKYKNIIYPFDSYSVDSYGSSSSKARAYYDIDMSSLQKSLSVSRSRDRIDMEQNEKDRIEVEITDLYYEMFSKIRDFVSTVVEHSSIKNLIKLNYIMKHVMDSGINRSYSASFKDHIDSLVAKKILPKNYVYESEFKTLEDIFKVKKPEEAYAIAELTTGLDSYTASRILNSFGFCHIPDFDRIFQTIESESEKKLKWAHDQRLVARQVNNGEKISEADKISHQVEALDGFKRSIKGYLGSSSCIFVFKDMKKSFKLPCGMLHYDDDLEFDKIFLMDYERCKDVYDTLIKEGVKNVFKVSELHDRYIDSINEIKEDRKVSKKQGTDKRVGGIYRFNEKMRGGGYYEMQSKSKKTVQSSDLLRATESASAVYVMKMRNQRATAFATTQDGKDVTINFKVEFHDYVLEKDFGGEMEIRNTSSGDTRVKMLDDSDITMFMEKDSIFIACDESKYDRIVEYIDNDNIYSYIDFLEDRIKNTTLIVNEPVTVESIVHNIDDIKDRINNSLGDDSNSRETKILNNQAYNCCSNLLGELRRTKMLDMESNIRGTAGDFFERFMIGVSDVVKSSESYDIAEQLFKKLTENTLARVLIRGINMSSVRIESDEVIEELLNHLIDQAEVRNILNSYLTK